MCVSSVKKKTKNSPTKSLCTLWKIMYYTDIGTKCVTSTSHAYEVAVTSGGGGDGGGVTGVTAAKTVNWKICYCQNQIIFL